MGGRNGIKWGKRKLQRSETCSVSKAEYHVLSKSPYFSLSDKCYIHLVCIKCFIMKLNILKKILKVLDQIDISNSGINISPQRLDYC